MSSKKGTTLPLDQFLKPNPKITNWAEDEDFDADLPVSPLPSRPGPSPAAEPAREAFKSLPVFPDQPPYKVYIGNVPYELTEGDLSDLFKDLQIRDTHFLTHHDTGKLKGVFVEFGSKDGLQTALQMNGTSVLGRALRIDIAEARPERSRGGYGDREQGGYGFDRPDYNAGERGADRSRGGGYSRDYESSDRGRGGGGFRDDRGGFPDRGQADRGDRRGFGSNYEQDDRRGGSFRDRPRGDYGGFSGARDEGQGRWGREASAPVAQAPSEALSGGPRGSDVSAQLDRSSSEQRSNLTLQRAPSSTSATSEAAKPKSNPFGSAKPVDTVARLKELEERDAKRKAEEALKRREAAAAATAPAPATRQPTQAAPVMILKPTGPSASDAAVSPSQKPAVQQAQPSSQRSPQANGSAAAPPKAAASSVVAAAEAVIASAPAVTKAEAPRAPAWGKPAQAPAAGGKAQGTSQQPSAPAQPASAQPEQGKPSAPPTEQPPKAESAAQPQQAKQAAQQQAGAQAVSAAAPTAGQDVSKERSAAAKPERVAWGKASDNGPTATGQASTSRQPNAWGKPKTQPAPTSQAPAQAQPTSESQLEAQARPESSQGQSQGDGKPSSSAQAAPAADPAQPGKQAPPSTEQTGQEDRQAQAKGSALGAQAPSEKGATLPLNHRSQPRQHQHQQQQHRQQRGQPRRPVSVAAAIGDNAPTAPTTSGDASAQQPEQDSTGQDAGWVEVSSTRSSGGQDAGGSVEAGRGRGRGRGRDRGRYEQDNSGGRGSGDRFAGRGPGRGRGGRYEGSTRGGGRSQGRGKQYQGQDRNSQAPVAPPPGLPQDNKAGAEEGWEQPGRQGGSRSGRGSSRGSHTPNILQRPDRAPAAWGNANALQPNAAPQARAPPGLAVQPEVQQSEASNPFDLLGEN